jgi:antitoxin VapB
MSLNIKDREAHELAQALARETGETMTRAVTEALRERLQRVRRQRRPETTVKELLALGRRCARPSLAPEQGCKRPGL